MIKTLMKSIRDNKKVTIVTPLLVSVESILDVIIPFLMSILIDNGINKSDVGVIYKVGAALILCE